MRHHLVLRGIPLLAATRRNQHIKDSPPHPLIHSYIFKRFYWRHRISILGGGVSLDAPCATTTKCRWHYMRPKSYIGLLIVPVSLLCPQSIHCWNIIFLANHTRFWSSITTVYLICLWKETSTRWNDGGEIFYFEKMRAHLQKSPSTNSSRFLRLLPFFTLLLPVGCNLEKSSDSINPALLRATYPHARPLLQYNSSSPTLGTQKPGVILDSTCDTHL